MSTAPIHVLAGVLRDSRGRLLVCQRPPGKHLAGMWEFPGGKREAGESRQEALTRELREELGIDVIDARPLCALHHDYAASAIRLDAWQVDRWHGEPVGLDGQAFAWVMPAELASWPLAPADLGILTASRLHDVYAITPEPDSAQLDAFVDRVGRLFAGGIRLLQLRTKTLDAARLSRVARRCRDSAERHGADLLLNGQPELAADLGVGLHLPAGLLRCWHTGDIDAGAEAWLPRRPDGGFVAGIEAAGGGRRSNRRARGWLAASCHDPDELAMAAGLGCDFAVVAAVADTPSHPTAMPLGWPGFDALVKKSRLPVYALGGMAHEDADTARDHGARGIAGIRAFWPGD